MCDLRICRICLNTAVRGYKLEKYSLRSYYEYVVRQKLSANDTLPQWVCYECAMMLHKFHKFKEKCLEGQNVLKQIASRGSIGYDAIAAKNRYTENLASPIGIAIPSKRVKTTTTKHKPNLALPIRIAIPSKRAKTTTTKNKPKRIKLEKVLKNVESQDSMKQEDLEVKDNNLFNNVIIEYKPDEKPINQVKIKTETNVPEIAVELKQNKSERSTFDSIQNTDLNTKIDIDNTNTEIPNDVDIDDMSNTDQIDNAVSSDDEKISLNIVKKAIEGESKQVVLDNMEMEPIKKKIKDTKGSENSKGKVHKFEKPKKENLSSEHWRKFNLNEEEAILDFKQRENSDQYVKANYKCHNCLKGFSKVEMLMRHVKFRHEETCGPIECRFCHIRFKQKSKLCRHLKEHYAVYQCLRCDMRFRVEGSAIAHEDYHNGVTRKCKHCGEEFKHSSTYYTHLRMSHRSEHVCVACGASFATAAGLQRHRKIKHYENADEASNDPAPEANTYCSKCNIKFETQAAYDEHLTHSNMHGDLNADSEIRNLKGYKKVGPQSFKGLRKKKKPTTCQYCGKHFATQGQCMTHHFAEHPRRSFHPPDKRHICEVCGQSLAAVSIASHMNMHTREHVYPCATCGMKFITKSSLNRHQVTHTGEKKYPCPLCEKRFTQRNSMKLHYRTFHLKEPYPKRNSRKNTDDVEMPIMECRDRDLDDDSPPARRSRARF